MQSILRHIPDLPRLRISSIDSIEADEALYDAIASDRRLMPHLHLSLQSGDDMILKRMKRRHLRARRAGVRGQAPRAPARHGVRRRHHRRLPHRDRGDVREHAAHRRARPTSPISTSSPIRRAKARRPRRMPQVDQRRSARPVPLACAPWASSNICKLCESRVGAIENRAGRAQRHRPHRAVHPHGRCPATPPANSCRSVVTGVTAAGLVGEALRTAA